MKNRIELSAGSVESKFPSLFEKYLNSEIEIGDLTYNEFNKLMLEWYNSFKRTGGNYTTIIQTLITHSKSIELDADKEKELKIINLWLEKNINVIESQTEKTSIVSFPQHPRNETEMERNRRLAILEATFNDLFPNEE